MDSYEQRVVAYADIVGWTAACQDPSRYSQLRNAAQAIASYARNFSQEIKGKVERIKDTVPVSLVEEHASFEFSFFSDNFAVSAPSRYADQLFKILAFACNSLLRANFLVRGGVTLGALHHHDNLLFGPALIEAVDLEGLASYPRLLCSPSLVEFLVATSYRDHVIIRDREQDLVANIACGGPDALRDLNGVLEGELTTLRLNGTEKAVGKWSYLQDMLPRMYQAKGHSRD
jgi:hypothetical protein